MFALYLETLNFNVALSILAVLTAATVSGHDLTAREFIFPLGIQVLATSLVFLLRELLRLYDGRIAARVFAQHTRGQLAAFRRALRNQAPDRPNFTRGFKTWNS